MAKRLSLVVFGLLLGAGAPSVRADEPPPTPAAPAPAPAAPEVALLVEPDLGGVDPDVLVLPGDVPLHGRDQIAWATLFERAFELGLGAPERDMLRTSLARHLRDAGSLERQEWLALLDAHEQVMADEHIGRDEAVRAALERFRIELDRCLANRQDGDLHRTVAQVLGRSRTAVWPGNPPVDGVRADAFMEACTFVAGLGRNERIALTNGQQATLEEHLRAQLAGRDVKDREAVREISLLWAHVRRTWPSLSTAAKLRARGAAAALLVRLVPGEAPRDERPVPDTVHDLVAAATEARRLGGPFTATTNVALNPRHVRHVLRAALEEVDSESTPLTRH
ncbi:MAG: hypothetical protein H6806_00550 [Planctomycetes bacterium]|nr:hypothetical protein [Planctomycetota bacterium]MCB9828234.1 hypothetical protein [Planctomycetota bacterium]